MIRLITDFDGPLVDVSDRYYRVYRFCLEQAREAGQPVRALSKERFWQLKRARVPERRIGRMSGLDEAQAQIFAHLRRVNIHTLPYLIHDCLQPDAIPVLERAQRAGMALSVLTMRRHQELAFALDRFGLERFFPPQQCYCLGNAAVKTGDVRDKSLLMARALAELPPASEVWMVGDTEADILAARANGVRSIGVLCGIRNREQLQRYRPDCLADSLGDAIETVATATSAVASG
ncbi:MAG: haloacid dehalogenase [Cyanobacteria bacterium QS_8_64_29]|nr:MAG: haloacid dehalogenase [Cyanobacteria bacterium QS_8_64_29]